MEDLLFIKGFQYFDFNFSLSHSVLIAYILNQSVFDDSYVGLFVIHLCNNWNIAVAPIQGVPFKSFPSK